MDTNVNSWFMMKILDKDAVDNDLRYKITYELKYEMPQCPLFMNNIEFMF